MKDFDGCWTVINEAREQMIKSGRHQWTEQYPAYKDILADINNGNAYVLTVNDQIAVYGAVVLNGEPAYEFLEGKWLTNSNYYVIHRFATLPKLQREGYARIFINKVCSLCEVEHVPSIKVDTNYDNLPMVSLLSSMGFCLCGKVSYGERGLRFAFEKNHHAAQRIKRRNSQKFRRKKYNDDQQEQDKIYQVARTEEKPQQGR